MADHVDAAREYFSRRATGNEPAAGALASWVDARREAVARGELSNGQAKNGAWAAKAFAASPLAGDSLPMGPGGKDGIVRQLSAA